MNKKILLIMIFFSIGFCYSEKRTSEITADYGKMLKQKELIHKIYSNVDFEKTCVKKEIYYNKEQFTVYHKGGADYEVRSVRFVKTKEGVMLC
jgi:hypothetical protein